MQPFKKNRAFLLLPFYAFIAIFGQLCALESQNGDASLLIEPPPKPVVMNLEFGASPKQVLDAMIKMGTKLEDQEVIDHKGYVKALSFDGIPPLLGVEEGKTRVLFFKNQMIRLDFTYTPSYTHFLTVREALLKTMDPRFSVEKKVENIDSMLRAHLALLEAKQISESTEVDVIQSIQDHKTFFFYQIKDRQNELNVTLSYNAPKEANGTRKPELLLHYSLKSGIDAYQEYAKGVKKNAEDKGTTP